MDSISDLDQDAVDARLQKLMQRFAYQFSGENIGFYIEPGWFDLVEKTCVAVDQSLSVAERKKFHWKQIKEKFGGLRMYYAGGPLRVDILNAGQISSFKSEAGQGDPFRDVISQAEDASFETCAVCGAPGRLRRDRSWLRTLCDQHAAKK